MIGKIKGCINYLRLNTIQYFRKLRLYYNSDKERTSHLKKQVNCNHKWYGSIYGGFYINPDLLNKNSIIYSFGIGKDITFDLKCINKHMCKVFGFDPTPKSKNYINSLKKNNLFVFNDYGISCNTGLKKFFLPANPHGVSGSAIINESLDKENSVDVLMKSFSDITNDLGHKHIDVLKIDIEGSEYEVLESIMETDVEIDQVLIEFHDRHFNTSVVRSKQTIEMMNRKGYRIFAVSMSYEEVSFINTKFL